MIHVDSEWLAWVLSSLIIIGAAGVLWSIGFTAYRLFMRVRYGIIVELEKVFYDAHGEVLEEDYED